jgi:RimJ/RimL family protein N-acetyltransferase
VHPARLVAPTVALRDSWLAAARADGEPADLVDRLGRDFAGFVASLTGVRTRWGVPATFYWYRSGEHYLGDLAIRHTLTPALATVGGHVGYRIATPWRRQGHATRLLAAGLVECGRLGLARVLLTCGVDNIASRRVILANGGVPDGRADGEDRFWITVPPADGRTTDAGLGR